ncbi:MAG: LacI family DNA-binding transcriptional regulator [Rhodothermales bacterium]|nr:LacI family DNA-binding transcriptional regulator [Rhodothermales bacterium]
MPVTIYDIASKAGVSIATVSRVFNESPRVSPSTRSNVLEVAAQLGYQPHATARSLARRKSSIVSAVIPMLTNYFFVEILRGLQDTLAKTEYDLLVFSARTLDEVDGQMDRALQRGQAAGILVFSSPMTPARVERLSKAKEALVLVDCFHAGLDSVTTNNVEGGNLATKHLLEQGCQRIALLMANPESVPARDRREGYVRALEAAGRAVEENLIVVSADEEHHGYSEKSGYDAMRQLLSVAEPPDGVFATSDVQAIGALRAISEAGLPVPDTIRVVGYDDILISQHVGLTTIRQPMYEMGVVAAKRLLSQVSSPTQVRAQTVLSPSLVVRRTTGGQSELAHTEVAQS